jgi:phenylacetate-CoA ligase
MKHQEQKYWDMEIEPKLNTPEIKDIQWRKLKDAIAYHYENVPFDRKRMDRAGVKPDYIQSIDDFSRSLPHIAQNDYRKVIEEVGLDMDKVLVEIMGEKRFKDIYMVASTSGTTGLPTPYPILKSSITKKGAGGRATWRIGIRPGDRIAICFGLSMHMAGTPQVLNYLDYPGVSLLPIGAEAGTERMLTLLKFFKATVFSGTPSLALHLIERAPEVLGHPVKDLGIRILMLGAEPGAGIPEVREHLEKSYGAKVFDGGGGYGVSCNYPIYQGMHSFADDHCLYELVNPESGEPVPLTHGATGIAVFTSLDPWNPGYFMNLRMTANDIHQVFTDPCPCGMSGYRYKIIGRADDMLKVKGVPVYPAAIEGVIHGFLPRVTGAFRIILDEPPPRVVPPLKLKIEYGEGMTESDLPQLEKEILEKMHGTLKIGPKITWIKPNTLERATKKTQVFEKNY